MKEIMIVRRIGEAAPAPPRQAEMNFTIADIRKALSGNLIPPSPILAQVLPKLNFALINLRNINAPREAGRPRPGDEADFAQYVKQVADNLRRAGLFAVEVEI